MLVSAARRDTARARAETAARTHEITELTEIGIQLTTEKNYNTLLDLILTQARRITQSDAGSLYVVEAADRGEKHLRFKLSQNDSRPDIPFVEFTMPIDQESLAGLRGFRGRAAGDRRRVHAAAGRGVRVQSLVRRAVRVPHQVDAGHPDESTTTEDVIGVLQLINRKRDFASRRSPRWRRPTGRSSPTARTP